MGIRSGIAVQMDRYIKCFRMKIFSEIFSRNTSSLVGVMQFFPGILKYLPEKSRRKNGELK